MSERSSTSSEEWLLLNLEDEPLLDATAETASNIDVNLDSTALATEAIEHSRHYEELQQANDHVEEITDLNPNQASNSEVIQTFDRGIPNLMQKSDISDDAASYTEYEKDYSFNMASIHKTQCYKHNPNHRVNFILNLMLALAVSSAFSLGTGYFLGWSHKCWEDDSVYPDETHEYVLPSQAVIYQVVESSEKPESGQYSLEMPIEIESTAVSQPEEIVISDLLSDMEEPIEVNEDIFSSEKLINALELPVEMENTALSGTNKMQKLGENTVSVVSSEPFENDLSVEISKLASGNSQEKVSSDLSFAIDSNDTFQENSATDSKSVTDFSALSNINVNLDTSTDVATKQSENVSSDFEHISKLSPKVEVSEFDPIDYVNEHFTDFTHSAITVIEGELNTQSSEVSQKSKNELNNNFTIRLKEDLIKIIHGINNITSFQFSNDRVNLEQLSNFYYELQNLTITKIDFINNFVQCEIFKTHPKQSIKHLQKMIYGLIDFMDSVVKSSLGALGKQSKKVNGHRLSKNLFKLSGSFNKKWERFQKKWEENSDRVQNREFKQKYLQDFKVPAHKEHERKSSTNFEKSTKEIKESNPPKDRKQWKKKDGIKKPEKRSLKKYSEK